MGASLGRWHQTNTQLAEQSPRVEQADGSNRTGLTLTDFYVQLRDQGDNIEYQKAEGNPTPSVYLIAVTCDEVGEGRYVFAFTPNANGLWKLDVQYSTDGYKADGSWEAVASVGFVGGVCTIQVTIKETDENGDPVSDVSVSVKNASGNEISRDTTDSNGQALGLHVMGAATYTVAMSKEGWTFDDESLLVSASDITAGSKAVEYYGTEFDPGTPAGDCCRIYGWLREIEGGVAVRDQRIKAELYDDDRPAVGDGVYYVSDASQDTPDSEGYWYLDLIRSTLMADGRVRVWSMDLQSSLPSGAIDKLIRVPDQASAELASIEAVAG